MQDFFHQEYVHISHKDVWNIWLMLWLSLRLPSNCGGSNPLVSTKTIHVPRVFSGGEVATFETQPLCELIHHICSGHITLKLLQNNENLKVFTKTIWSSTTLILNHVMFSITYLMTSLFSVIVSSFLLQSAAQAGAFQLKIRWRETDLFSFIYKPPVDHMRAVTYTPWN